MIKFLNFCFCKSAFNNINDCCVQQKEFDFYFVEISNIKKTEMESKLIVKLSKEKIIL